MNSKPSNPAFLHCSVWKKLDPPAPLTWLRNRRHRAPRVVDGRCDLPPVAHYTAVRAHQPLDLSIALECIALRMHCGVFSVDLLLGLAWFGAVLQPSFIAAAPTINPPPTPSTIT